MGNEYKIGNILIYIVILFLFGVLGFFIVKQFIMDDVSPFVSEYDGKNYSVRNFGSPKEKVTAANYLASLNHKVDTIVDYAYKNKLPNVDTANRLYYRWNKCELKETSSFDKSAAFTLNKSTEIRICIRDKNGDFENPNTSMFVLLHELAHVMSISYGHESEFKENFSFITNLASNLGIYKPEDFRNHPTNYCGVDISTTPCSVTGCEFNVIKKY